MTKKSESARLRHMMAKAEAAKKAVANQNKPDPLKAEAEQLAAQVTVLTQALSGCLPIVQAVRLANEQGRSISVSVTRLKMIEQAGVMALQQTQAVQLGEAPKPATDEKPAAPAPAPAKTEEI